MSVCGIVAPKRMDRLWCGFFCLKADMIEMVLSYNLWRSVQAFQGHHLFLLAAVGFYTHNGYLLYFQTYKCDLYLQTALIFDVWLHFERFILSLKLTKIWWKALFKLNAIKYCNRKLTLRNNHLNWNKLVYRQKK